MKPDLGLLILRVGVSGLLIYSHGWAKLMHFSERSATFADPLHIGSALGFTLVVFAEVVCSSLVAVGLFTRLATIPLLIFFSVAVFIQHVHDPWPKKELPLLFGFAYAALLCTGAGRYSLDARRPGRRS